MSDPIDVLADKIRKHRALYYEGRPIISDDEFDALEDLLRRLAPEHRVLSEIGAKPQAASKRAKAAPEAKSEAEATPEATPEAEAKTEAKATRKAKPKEASEEEIQAWVEQIREHTLRAYREPAQRWLKSKGIRAHRALLKQLQKQRPDHPVFQEIPPINGVWPEAPHEIPMGSLNKVNSDLEFWDWIEGLKAEAPELPDEGWLLSEKLDGISIELIYEDGAFIEAITRGDGDTGERITLNLRHIPSLPKSIEAEGRISVRGELILEAEAQKAFEAMRSQLEAERLEEARELWETRVQNAHAEWLRKKAKAEKNGKAFNEEAPKPKPFVPPKPEKPIKNPRNAAAGAARVSGIEKLYALPYLSIRCYDLLGYPGIETEVQKMTQLKALGFLLPNWESGTLETLLARQKAYQGKLREQLPYEIDGLVIRLSPVALAEGLGLRYARPKAAIAYKFENKLGITRLREITWSTGPSGRVTPVALVEPVEVAGVTISQVNLHNVENIERLGIGEGDEIEISRRNDVIPYVERVILSVGKPPKLPERCAVCQSKLEQDRVLIRCPNRSCQARVVGRLAAWLKVVDALEWGGAVLNAIVKAGLAKEPADLYKLQRDQLAELKYDSGTQLGKTIADKLIKSLKGEEKGEEKDEEKRSLSLLQFLSALAISDIDEATFTLIIEAGFDTLAKIQSATYADLLALPGIGDFRAQRVVDGLALRKTEIANLLAVPIRVIERKDAAGEGLLGLSFCFSGRFSMTKPELEARVRSEGGTVEPRVMKNLSYLVLANADSTTSKAQKARALGIPILDDAGFQALFEEIDRRRLEEGQSHEKQGEAEADSLKWIRATKNMQRLRLRPIRWSQGTLPRQVKWRLKRSDTRRGSRNRSLS